VWGQRFTVELERHITLFRYRDVPGMIGRIGTMLGGRDINIDSAAVGRQPAGDDQPDGALAAMAVTTDAPMPRDVLDEIVASEGFVDGRTITL
jgi:D-3-phosphoglycerate dehydrogenase